MLAGETAVAAPAGLASAVTSAALATGAATVGAGAVGLLALSKLQLGLAAAVVAGGAVGLVVQQRTISALREQGARSQAQLATLAAENSSLSQSATAAHAEVAQLRATASPPPRSPAASSSSVVRAPVPPAPATRPALGPITLRPVPDTPETQRQRAALHRQFDPFFQRRHLTPAQMDRLIELRLQRAEARQDLQDAVNAAGLRGIAAGVEDLRSQLYAPIVREELAILGPEGDAAYVKFEQSSYYRVSFVDPLLPSFSLAHAPLSAPQVDQLAQVIAQHHHSVRLKPTDIGTVTRVDWAAVVASAGAILSPAQLTLLQNYASHQNP